MSGDRIIGVIGFFIMGLVLIFGDDFSSRGVYFHGANKVFLGVVCLVVSATILFIRPKKKE